MVSRTTMVVVLLLLSLVSLASPSQSQKYPAVQILHPCEGQVISAAWQDVLIASIQHFDVPKDGTVAVYIDNQLAARLRERPTSLGLPVLPEGEHEIAVSLQDESQDVVTETVVTVVYASRIKPPPLWNFAGGFPELPTMSAAQEVRGGEELTVIWTCPDWEVDWISEILDGAGLAFKLVYDKTFSILVNNSLLAVSQNDERNRSPDVLASYLLEVRRRGLRIGVLHMSDEDYSASSYFYPWVHYVMRNHLQEELARLPHTLAIPLGYKKGYWEDGSLYSNLTARYAFVDQLDDQGEEGKGGSRGRKFVWNFVGQTHDKPTRESMMRAARRVEGGYWKLTSYWNDPSGLSTRQFRQLLSSSTFTLCPRGFVHPESFRLSEALESGSIPVVEEDAYFAGLLGDDHPLVMLPPPTNCSVPRTTRYHPPPHPRPDCADVWSGVDERLRSLLEDAPALREKVKTWWRRMKETLKKRVRSLVLTGLPSLSEPDVQERERGRRGGREEVEDVEGYEEEIGGGKEEEEEEQDGGLDSRASSSSSSRAEQVCGHHDLACRARWRYEENHILTDNILEARRKMKELFPDGSEPASDQQAPDWSIGEEEEERASFGLYPHGCRDDCDCPGASACVDGACDRHTRGACESGRSSFMDETFDAILVVNMNDTEVDRARWEEAQAQLKKFSVRGTRFPGVEGAKFGSRDMQGLLNDGTVSPLHDSLVMDEKRSVLGCALVHLEIYQHILTSGYRWALILEDDFLLPPHFPRLLELYWRHAPSYLDTDVLYLGAGSNRKGPRSWINRFLFRPQQTVGTHAYAVTSHGAEKLLSALRPLIQSIDSQIHETLLDSLNIFAFPSPDSPSSSSSSSRPYQLPPGYIAQPFSFDLSEPHFFPSGSLYHGIISVDQTLPTTIPKEGAVGRKGRPATFFRSPLDGDIVKGPDVAFDFIVHNFHVWNPDGSEPEGLKKGFVQMSVNGREVMRCGQRMCGVKLMDVEDGNYRASLAMFDQSGELVGEEVEIGFTVCMGQYDCSPGTCECVK
mmetsp:Transcript_12175/g.42357  ORF Transcript_12175/g.42357 Transcript_12175/m.42357 type:complete len:1028 (-) Transcript_12175:32-3115(-)